jgi:hypothetical protein
MHISPVDMKLLYTCVNVWCDVTQWSTDSEKWQWRPPPDPGKLCRAMVIHGGSRTSVVLMGIGHGCSRHRAIYAQSCRHLLGHERVYRERVTKASTYVPWMDHGKTDSIRGQWIPSIVSSVANQFAKDSSWLRMRAITLGAYTAKWQGDICVWS